MLTRCFAITLVVTAGCRSYTPDPLDAAAHRDAWKARRPTADEVTAYALELAERGARFAATFDPADGLTLDEAVVVALFFNPDLRRQRLQAGVALANAENAGLWRDPRLQVTGLRVLEDVSKPWFLAGQLSVTIPISGRLSALKARARARANAAHHDVHVAEWRLIARLREAWCTWAATVERITLLNEYLERLATLAKIARALGEAGEISRLAARVIALEELSHRSSLHHEHASAERLKLTLRRLLGLRPDAPVVFDATLPVCPPIPSRDALVPELVERNPLILQSAARYDVAERQLALAIAGQYPDLTIGPSSEYEESTDRLGLIFSLPLPLWNRNRQAIARAAAARAVARQAHEATCESQEFALYEAWQRATEAHEHWTFQRREMLPLVAKQLEDVETMQALRSFDLQWVLDSLELAFDTKRDILETRLEETLAHQALDAIVCRTHVDCRKEVSR